LLNICRIYPSFGGGASIRLGLFLIVAKFTVSSSGNNDFMAGVMPTLRMPLEAANE
jgi:hypothetical protein